MRGIIVTPSNYNWVVSKLQKFFSHNSFSGWHCFSGGLKKRIPATIRFDHYRSAVIWTRRHYSKIDFSVDPNTRNAFVTLSETEGFPIYIGLEVLFVGNRVIFKRPFGLGKLCGKFYIYSCFQIE